VHFPRLKKAGDTLKPGGKYKGVELLEGWLMSQRTRENEPLEVDPKRLASVLMNELDRQVQSAVSDHGFTVLQAFDSTGLVGLQCGVLLADSVGKLDIENGQYDT